MCQPTFKIRKKCVSHGFRSHGKNVTWNASVKASEIINWGPRVPKESLVSNGIFGGFLFSVLGKKLFDIRALQGKNIWVLFKTLLWRSYPTVSEHLDAGRLINFFIWQSSCCLTDKITFPIKINTHASAFLLGRFPPQCCGVVYCHVLGSLRLDVVLTSFQTSFRMQLSRSSRPDIVWDGGDPGHSSLLLSRSGVVLCSTEEYWSSTL